MFDEILYPKSEEENEAATKQNSYSFEHFIIAGLIVILVFVMVGLPVFWEQ